MTIEAQLCQQRTRSDLLINFNGTDHHAHFIILAIKCNYFESLLFSQCQEKTQGRITITLEDISQSAFAHFLDYVYGAPLESAHIQDLIKLADYFQCDELAAECAKFPLHKLGSAVQPATWIIQELIPSFTLLEKDTFMQDVKLKEAFLWFSLNFDGIVKLELDLLSSIPMDWLRFVFGKAPCHCFDSESDRLDKAIAFYLRMGHSDELFSTLFENIRYACIPSTGLLDRKYLFLYRTPNETVRRKVMGPRGSALPPEELKTNFTSLMLTCERSDWDRQGNDVFFGKDIKMLLRTKDSKLRIEITSISSKPYHCDISGYILVIKEKGQGVFWEPFTLETMVSEYIERLDLPVPQSFLENYKETVKLIVHISNINIVKEKA
jgi:hypothetical protein